MNINTVRSYFRYHPSVGYWWEFKDGKNTEKKKEETTKNENCGTKFQKTRIDLLLREQIKKFPPKVSQPPQAQNVQSKTENNTSTDKKNQTGA